MTPRALFLLLAAVLACAPPAEQAAAPAVAPPDTAAIRAELRAMSDQVQAQYLAGSASSVAASFTEDARAEFQGFPSAVGRAAIESLYVGYFSTTKLSVAEVTLGGVNATAPDAATALGIFHSFGDVSGKPTHAWWRFAAAYRKEADGQWRTSYIMAFPDSTK